MLLFQLLFLFLFTGVELFNCPKGSDQIPREDICLYTVNEPEFYFDAYRHCQTLGGVTAKIQNIYENSFLFVSIPKDANGNPTAPYIGVERKKNNTWAYSDGTPLIYQNWALNEPNNASNTSICAIMDPTTGKWLAAECSLARPYFCTTNGDDVQCPDGWVYNEKTDFCYYLQNFTYPDSVHWQMYNGTTAELNCQRMGAHLVSIHNKAEDDFVYDLITTNVKNMSIAAPDQDSCNYHWAWIGYYGNGTLGTGTWTDGSQVDYFGENPSSIFYSWKMSNDQSCNYKQWGATGSTYIFARFVCKIPSTSRQLRKESEKGVKTSKKTLK